MEEAQRVGHMLRGNEQNPGTELFRLGFENGSALLENTALPVRPYRMAGSEGVGSATISLCSFVCEPVPLLCARVFSSFLDNKLLEGPAKVQYFTFSCSSISIWRMNE